MVKKLAVFCDGTWNQLRTPHLTNVARLAKCVAPVDGAGVPQIVFYDEGVGVGLNVSPTIDKLIAWIGGAFGRGLDRKVETAYRFIALNYDPDDEIYIFGFSRGAFTARSLCGLIRKCGIVRRDCLNQVPAALELYRNPVHPTDATIVSFRKSYSHPRTTGAEDMNWVQPLSAEARGMRSEKEVRTRADLFHHGRDLSYRMMYLGVWDTVGALGVPKTLSPLRFLNKKYRFHDTNASTLISSIRHAVALEEDRRVFDVTPVSNIIELNTKWATATGWNVNDPSDPKFVPYNHRPYQQLWFPGNHGAVGGGNAAIGLSSATLVWIAEGAHEAGLAFRQDPLNELWQASQTVNPMADWRVNKDGTPQRHNRSSWIGRLGGFITRQGPARVDEVGLPAKIRWCRDPAWRPKNLGVLKLSDCQTFAVPAAPPDFPASASGFPPEWSYAVPPPSRVTPSAA